MTDAPVFTFAAMQSTLDLSADDLEVLAQHGRRFPRVSEPPRSVGRGAPGLCFNNTALFVAANPGWSYVEGAATSEGMRVHHAWAIRGSVALEVTWREPGTAYVGVPLGDGPRFIPGLRGCYSDNPVVLNILASSSARRSSPHPRRPNGMFGWDSLRPRA